MNWLTNFIRPRIRSLVQPKEVPDNLWQKCPACEGMLFHRDLTENLNVCYHCGHHLRFTVKERLAILFDGGTYETFEIPNVAQDPLKFKDKKRYADRLKESQAKTKLKDAMTIAKGTMDGMPVVIAAFNFSFMGGSMGMAVGEAIIKGAEEAIKANAAFIVVPSSGGARMQEGMLSLIQMPRTIIAVEMVKEAKLPYIVLLTDPTTGGVSASFAMVGDIHIAEPGSTIGFAGKRVIEETIREQLPPGFQTAEYLLSHGMVDMVVPRKELRQTLIRIIGMLTNQGSPAANGKNGNGKGKKSISGRPNGQLPTSYGGAGAKAMAQVKQAEKAIKSLSETVKKPRKSKKAAGA